MGVCNSNTQPESAENRLPETDININLQQKLQMYDIKMQEISTENQKLKHDIIHLNVKVDALSNVISKFQKDNAKSNERKHKNDIIHLNAKVDALTNVISKLKNDMPLAPAYKEGEKQHLSNIATIESYDDEYSEYRMDARKRQLLVYGYVRIQFEEQNYDIIFPLEIKNLLRIFVALFGWDIMKKGYLIHIDDLNDYKIIKKLFHQNMCYQCVCFSEVLLSPFQYYFKLKIDSGKKNGIIVGIVKTAEYELYVNDCIKETYSSSKSFALCSNGMIMERIWKNNQTKQWNKNDILDVFIDMNELEMSFKLNDSPAANIIDIVGNEYYFFVALQCNNDSVELINYTVKEEMRENDSNDDCLFDDSSDKNDSSNDDWLFDNDSSDKKESSNDDWLFDDDSSDHNESNNSF